jgi:hypothetical protein
VKYTTMTVYRYENGFGRGPFHDHGRELLDQECYDQPGPHTDKGILRAPNHRAHCPLESELCACTSIAQLLDWFGSCAERLHAAGYDIVEYHSDQVTVGRHQVLIGIRRVVTNVYTSVEDAYERGAR